MSMILEKDLFVRIGKHLPLKHDEKYVVKLINRSWSSNNTTMHDHEE